MARGALRSYLHVCVVAMMLTGLAAAAVLAPNPTVHMGVFELGPSQGANIVDDPVAGRDWGSIFDADGNTVDISGGIAAAFIADDLSQGGGTDSTTYSGAGGSNKNNDLITDWHWDAGNVPAKDDLSNAYAFAVIDDNDHLILYAGFERIAENGDSHVDIEFFQDDVSLDEEVPCNDPGADPTPCDWLGVRTVGDVIVSMDFTIGGGLGSVSVRVWNGAEYVLEVELMGEGCNPAFTGAGGFVPADSLCGFNNGGTIDGGPWPNFNRHGDVIELLPRNAFTEFGVDVTALEGDIPCISTVLGKTRSSQSFTAELKDFAGPHSFPVCGAAIQINPPRDTNEVGEEHTFTVTVQRIVAGFPNPAPDGTPVTVTFTASYGAVVQVIDDNCATTGTVGGACTVTVTSFSAGTITAHAEADIQVGPLVVHVETDGIAPNSGDAVKIFVDAFIRITPPLDTNSVQERHTFTVEVQQNAGEGAGFTPVPDGTVVTVTLTDFAGAVSTDIVDSCASPGTSGGFCTVSFTSNTPGTVQGHASVTLVFGETVVVRETDGDGQNSGDAVKHFVAGTLSWRKVDNAGRLQGGATFTVCRTHDFNSGTGQMDDIADVCVAVLDDSAPDTDPDAGEFRLELLRLGRYTVTETTAPPGYVADPDTVTVDLTLNQPTRAILEAFVNLRPIVKITGFSYVNSPDGTPTDGVVTGTTVYTVELTNFGGASTELSGSLVISFVGGGDFGCDPACTIEISGTLNPGETAVFVLTVHYSDATDGSTVTADLNVMYTTNGLTRTASGSPASIVFTIQDD